MRDLSAYPGGDLVGQGLTDLAGNVLSVEALLVLVASPRLRQLGLTIPPGEYGSKPYEHQLYEALAERSPGGAHSAYNALIGRIVSFANAYRP